MTPHTTPPLALQLRAIAARAPMLDRPALAAAADAVEECARMREELAEVVRLHNDAHEYFARAENEHLRLRLHEIAEEWADAECGEPVTAQEAYAIQLARRMYQLAVSAIDAALAKEKA